MKRVLLIGLALLAAAAVVYLYPYVQTFIKMETGPLHVTSPSGMVCYCEYGDMKVTISPDAQAHIRFPLHEGKGETVYMEVTEETFSTRSPYRRLAVFPYVVDARGRIPVEINQEGYAEFTIKIPQHLFDAAEGYAIGTGGQSSIWIKDQEHPLPPRGNR